MIIWGFQQLHHQQYSDMPSTSLALDFWGILGPPAPLETYRQMENSRSPLCQPSGSCWALEEQWQGGITLQGPDERAPEWYSEKIKIHVVPPIWILTLAWLNLGQDLGLLSVIAQMNFQSPPGSFPKGWMPIAPFWQGLNSVFYISGNLAKVPNPSLHKAPKDSRTHAKRTPKIVSVILLPPLPPQDRWIDR